MDGVGGVEEHFMLPASFSAVKEERQKAEQYAGELLGKDEKAEDGLGNPKVPHRIEHHDKDDTVPAVIEVCIVSQEAAGRKRGQLQDRFLFKILPGHEEKKTERKLEEDILMIGMPETEL